MAVHHYAFVGTIAGVLWIISLSIICFLLVRFIGKIRVKPKGSRCDQNIGLAFAVFFFQIVSGVCFCVLRFYGGLYRADLVDLGDGMEPLAIIGPGFLFITFSLLLYVYIVRLYTTFRGTSFAYPLWFYYFVATEIAIFAICTFIGATFVHGILLGIALLGYILNLFFLSYLFVHSVGKLTRDTGDNGELLNLLTRFTTLVVVSLSTTFVVCLFLIMHGILEHDVTDAVVIFLQPFDAATNLACIYCQFSFAEDDYGKWFASCDGCMRRFFYRGRDTETNVRAQMGGSENVKSRTNDETKLDPNEHSI
eukprot:25645_1